MAADVLYSPVMPTDLKKNLLEYALGLVGNVDPSLLKFVRSLADAGRVAELPAVLKSLTDLLNSKDGRVIADVTTVAPLGKEELDALIGVIAPKRNVGAHTTYRSRDSWRHGD